MYKEKYLKYKKKYLLLKQQFGGYECETDANYFKDLSKLVCEIVRGAKLINESYLEFVKCENFDITSDTYKEAISDLPRSVNIVPHVVKKGICYLFGWLLRLPQISNINLSLIKVSIEGIDSDYSPNILMYLNKYLINQNSRDFVFESINQTSIPDSKLRHHGFFEKEYTSPSSLCNELELLNTTDKNLYKKCSFVNLYNTGGICSQPSFWDENNFRDINDSLTRQWINVLNKIQNDYFLQIDNFIIIIGASYNDTIMDSVKDSRTSLIGDVNKKLILFINPCFLVKSDSEDRSREELAFSKYKTYDEIIKSLDDNISRRDDYECEIKIYWKTYFRYIKLDIS